MVTTRRANGITKPSAVLSDETYSSPRVTSSHTTPRPKVSRGSTGLIPPPTHSPFIPTRTEQLLLLTYPTILLLGSLFSFSPSLYAPINSSVYSRHEQSFQPASDAPSYFAQKRNVFNVYFVKLGWFWCTAAFFTFHLLVSRGRAAQKRRSGGKGEIDVPTTRTIQWTKDAGVQWRQERDEQDAKIRRLYQAAFRYALATLFWVLTTQWFFGPALVDRGFALTGGACKIAEHELHAKSHDKIRLAEAALTNAACKIAGGRWTGGYDISGHVFILILGSGMLWLEMLPFLLSEWKGVGVGRVVRAFSGKDERVANELGAAGAELYRTPSLEVDRQKHPVKWTLKQWAMAATLSVASLSWWMLLMTAAFFHEWVEKLTAFALAFGGLWVVYVLPRGLPVFRAIVGMPGV